MSTVRSLLSDNDKPFFQQHLVAFIILIVFGVVLVIGAIVWIAKHSRKFEFDDSDDEKLEDELSDGELDRIASGTDFPDDDISSMGESDYVQTRNKGLSMVTDNTSFTSTKTFTVDLAVPSEDDKEEDDDDLAEGILVVGIPRSAHLAMKETATNSTNEEEVFQHVGIVQEPDDVVVEAKEEDNKAKEEAEKKATEEKAAAEEADKKATEEKAAIEEAEKKAAEEEAEAEQKAAAEKAAEEAEKKETEEEPATVPAEEPKADEVNDTEEAEQAPKEEEAV